MRRCCAFALALGLASGEARAACPAPTTTDDLAAAAAAAQVDWAGLDASAFAVHRDAAAGILACEGDILAPTDVMAWYRVDALDGYLARDDARTIGAFRAELAIAPGESLPPEIAPEGNRLYGLFEAARAAAPSGGALLSAPRGTTFRIDGSPGATRPTDRPAVVQLLTTGGQVLATVYLGPGEPEPKWAALARSRPEATETASAPGSALESERDAGAIGGKQPAVATHTSRRPLTIGLAGGSVAGAIAAGSLLAMAATARAEYDDLDADVSELDLAALRRRTNTLVLGSVGAGVAAAGLAVTAAVSVRW